MKDTFYLIAGFVLAAGLMIRLAAAIEHAQERRRERREMQRAAQKWGKP